MPILTEQERLGTLVAGRYRLDGVLGRGGTAIVFDAVHTWTGRRVALKLLRPEFAQDLELVRRFMQEARTAADLAHPNIVEVLDMGADEGDGTVFLVLELLEGETLSGLLARRSRLPSDEAIALLAPVMRALAEAHARGIVHRDVKPDNVFLARGADGTITPKLLDFGMAKMLESAWGHATQSGTLVGTPFYMSPEQAQGAPDVGAQSDVWSTGVLLYRAVTGVLPFTGTTPTALLLAIVGEPPASVASLAPEVPPHVARAIDRAILLDRSVRHQSMRTFADALAGAELPLPRSPRSVRPIAIGGAVLLIAGAALALGLSRDDDITHAASVRPAPETAATFVANAGPELVRSPSVVETSTPTAAPTDAGAAEAPLARGTPERQGAALTRPRGGAPATPPVLPATTTQAVPPTHGRLPGVTDVW